jgi:site-specific DNA-methyltransferase (adenine-specific)
MPLKAHEMVYVFSKRGAYYKRIDVVVEGKTKWVRDRTNERTQCKQFGIDHGTANGEGNEDGSRCATSVIKAASRQRRGGHPTEKPVALLKWLLERYCPAEGTVLDPTAGSFNTVLAAHELGLTGIGIEMNDGFYNAAVDRLIPIIAAEGDEEDEESVEKIEA